MKAKGKISAWYSWPVIILTLIVFWPIGVFLLIKRLSVDKQTAMTAGKIINGLGIASYVIAGVGLFSVISYGPEEDDFIYILFFAVAGYVLRRVAKKTKKEAEEVKKYLAIIINGNIRQLDAIAAASGKPYDTVVKDVQKLIDRGFLKDAFLNTNTREVILNNAYTYAPEQISGTTGASTNTATNTPAPELAPKVITCSCCGANNMIIGKIGECEYCGAPIKEV